MSITTPTTIATKYCGPTTFRCCLTWCSAQHRSALREHSSSGRNKPYVDINFNEIYCERESDSYAGYWIHTGNSIHLVCLYSQTFRESCVRTRERARGAGGGRGDEEGKRECVRSCLCVCCWSFALCCTIYLLSALRRTMATVAYQTAASRTTISLRCNSNSLLSELFTECNVQFDIDRLPNAQSHCMGN